MKKKFIDTLGEFLLKILMFGAIVFFVGEFFPEEGTSPVGYAIGSTIYAIWGAIIIFLAFYGLFIHDILYKEEQKEDESYEFLRKYIYENYVKKNKGGKR